MMAHIRSVVSQGQGLGLYASWCQWEMVLRVKSLGFMV